MPIGGLCPENWVVVWCYFAAIPAADARSNRQIGCTPPRSSPRQTYAMPPYDLTALRQHNSPHNRSPPMPIGVLGPENWVVV